MSENIREIILSVKTGTVAPTTVTPDFVGQLYLNTTTDVLSFAKSLTIGDYEEILDVTSGAGGDMTKAEYDIGDNGIVDKSEALNDGSSGGGNNVSASEARDHIDDTNNPHSVDKNDLGLGNVPDLDTTDAVNKAHDQNSDIKLDDGQANEVTSADLRSHLDNLTKHREINDGSSTTTNLYSAEHIDSLISASTSNLDMKNSVVTVADTNITLSGEQTINGVLTSSSRVGVVGQTLSEQNGIYITSAGAWTRTTDADVDSEVTNGLSFFISNSGSTKNGNQYILITADPIIVDTTPLTFIEVPRIVLGTTSGTATEGNDPRVPTQDENDALAGTDGTPSSANKYATDSDPRLHTQNTDTKLDEGQANEVTSADLRSHLDNTNNPHNTDIENLGSGTLAELNSAITDANVDDLGDPRTPTGVAGGELGGTYPNPTVNDGADGSAIHDNIANEISAIAEKSAPEMDDIVIIEDSGASFVKKKAKLSNLIASGQDAFFATSVAESISTATTFSQKVRLTFTPSEVGDYEILYSAMVTHENIRVFIDTRVQLDDTTTFHEIRQELNTLKKVDGAYYSRSGAFVLEGLTAVSHDIDFDFATGSSGKEVSIKEAYLIVRRIG